METVSDITDEEVKALTQSILIRYGLDFTCYEPTSLKRRIIRILNVFQFHSIHELWIKLLRDEKFVYSFMNEISVGMTSMFRDPVLWKHLKEHLLTEFTNCDRINIWHAGCSTGEEVFTMGILLKETGLLDRTRALATDINRDAIQAAQTGTYHRLKMTENADNYRQYNTWGDFTQYYDIVGRDIIMDPDLIQHASFHYHNLITDSIAGAYDIIFCRNVMIYFDNLAKQKLLEKFYHALKPGGYLIIGFYDTMLSLIDQQMLELANEEAKIFRRPLSVKV